MLATSLCRRLGALLTGTILFLLTAQAAAQCIKPKEDPTPADIDKAKKHMKAGVDLQPSPDAGHCEEAYPEFKKAYQLSGSLNALQNLAFCAEKLELDGEAIACLKRYVDKKGEMTEEEKASYDYPGHLNALETAVSWVTVTSDQEGTQLVDVRTPRSGASVRNMYTIGTSPFKIGIHPGDHELTAKANGFPDQKWTVTIDNGAKLSKDFVFQKGGPVTAEGMSAEEGGQKPVVKPPEEEKKPVEPEKPAGPSRPVPGYVWAMVGVTGAAAIGWIGVGAKALSLNSAYKGDNNASSPAVSFGNTLSSEQATVKNFNTAADVLMGVTIASAATTIILFATRPEAPADKNQDKNKSAWTLAPLAGPGLGGAMLKASF